MKFKIGDKVSFLNENGKGEIISILSNFRVLVKNEDGFEVSCSIDEIVPIADKSQYESNSTMSKKWFDEKEEQEVKPPKLAFDEIWEVDLHLHEILDVGRILSDHEKLLYQLKHFRKCMDAAIAHRIKKIIFIHGVGKGTLKQELIHALKKYERANYFDAPYKKYGFGAIVVEFF